MKLFSSTQLKKYYVELYANCFLKTEKLIKHSKELDYYFKKFGPIKSKLITGRESTRLVFKLESNIKTHNS